MHIGSHFAKSCVSTKTSELWPLPINTGRADNAHHCRCAVVRSMSTTHSDSVTVSNVAPQRSLSCCFVLRWPVLLSAVRRAVLRCTTLCCAVRRKWKAMTAGDKHLRTKLDFPAAAAVHASGWAPACAQYCLPPGRSDVPGAFSS